MIVLQVKKDTLKTSHNVSHKGNMRGFTYIVECWLPKYQKQSFPPATGCVEKPAFNSLILNIDL